MTTATNIAFEIPFFEMPPTICKVYNDGGHYIAMPYKTTDKRLSPKRSVTYEREVFDSLYAYTLTEGLNKKQTQDFLRDNLAHLFESETKLEQFIADEMKRKAHNLHMRKKRFRRKANLNRWTHFVTITYDDKIHNEDTFRQKLRRCLCNLHTRRNWRYMGVFERAPETKRLHFHALVYVPDGEMIGELTEKRDYSTKSHKMQTTTENNFFAEKFGRNDFARINANEIKNGDTIGYFLKYLSKTGERITYSRGIPTEIYKEIDGNDIACEMHDFAIKYVLFDDVIDWETDIAHLHYEQMTITDYLSRYKC